MVNCGGDVGIATVRLCSHGSCTALARPGRGWKPSTSQSDGGRCRIDLCRVRLMGRVYLSCALGHCEVISDGAVHPEKTLLRVCLYGCGLSRV